jgi:hypothetical protein
MMKAGILASYLAAVLSSGIGLGQAWESSPTGVVSGWVRTGPYSAVFRMARTNVLSVEAGDVTVSGRLGAATQLITDGATIAGAVFTNGVDEPYLFQAHVTTPLSANNYVFRSRGIVDGSIAEATHRLGGVLGEAYVPATTTADLTELIGVYGYVHNHGVGVLTYAKPGYFVLGHSGTNLVNYAVGVTSDLDSNAGGIILQHHSFYAVDPHLSSGSTIGSHFDFYGSSTDGLAVTNHYGLYIRGAGKTNYIEGRLGLGTATPTNRLDVIGNAVVAGNSTVASNVVWSVASTNAGGVVYKGANTFLHDFTATGASGRNTFLGIGAGNLIMATNAASYETSENVGIGYHSLAGLTTGYHNSALGVSALELTTSGIGNCAVGDAALALNTTGASNNAMGANALASNDSGVSNTAVGDAALRYDTASNNSAVGAYALGKNTSGYNNVAVGSSAGRSNYIGYANTFLGYYAGYASGQLTNLHNSTAVGANAFTTASNQMVYGDTNVTAQILNGTVYATVAFQGGYNSAGGIAGKSVTNTWYSVTSDLAGVVTNVMKVLNGLTVSWLTNGVESMVTP